MRRRRQRGFTLTETMVVVAILGVIAVIALPRLARSRQSSGATDWARTLSKTLQNARLRAVSSRRPYQVTLTPTQAQTGFIDPITGLQGESVINAPKQGLTWDIAYTLTAPAAAAAFTHRVLFNPDLTVSIDAGASVNAYIYVATTTGKGQGRSEIIQIIGTGAVRIMGTSW